jgi:hypothetical protein
VYIENGIGCVVQRTVEVLGVENIAQHIDWSIFPNPTNQELNISLNLPRAAAISFVITNILGQKVLANTNTILPGVHTLSQNVSSLATGTYFITLSDGNNTSTRRFVITR